MSNITTEVVPANAIIAAEFLLLGERFERKSVRYEVLANHGRVVDTTDDGLVARVELVTCATYPDGTVVSTEVLVLDAGLGVWVDERRQLVYA